MAVYIAGGNLINAFVLAHSDLEFDSASIVLFSSGDVSLVFVDINEVREVVLAAYTATGFLNHEVFPAVA